MALPNLTPAQRSEALQKAAAARKVRAQVKAQLKNREVSLVEVLQRAVEDQALAKMRVATLLEAIPRVGVTTARATMAEIGIASSRRIRGLGQHQRAELVRRFS